MAMQMLRFPGIFSFCKSFAMTAKVTNLCCRQKKLLPPNSSVTWNASSHWNDFWLPQDGVWADFCDILVSHILKEDSPLSTSVSFCWTKPLSCIFYDKTAFLKLISLFHKMMAEIIMFGKVCLGVRDQAGSKNKCKKCSSIIQFIFNLQRKISSQVFNK
jgi:hypothetical protein